MKCDPGTPPRTFATVGSMAVVVVADNKFLPVAMLLWLVLSRALQGGQVPAMQPVPASLLFQDTGVSSTRVGWNIFCIATL